ncbi:MAG TPA: phospholipid carrier-dependent glycosyltransferase [Candidatus Dormibacteraeota bacterium]|nr:phospholipid carrier-dependent glycosyltransferase [Candidatus Dormibacteraeota bacterium]
MGNRAAAAARGALALIMVAACVLAAGSWRVYSNTWDEPEHLAAGIELLDRGQYEYDTEHPPLGRIPLALGPYLAGARSFGTPPPNGTQEGIDILYSGGHYQRTLTLARLGTLPFLALLLFSTWLWARRLLPSEGTAVLAVLLLASVPAVLGHAALASLDVAAAGTTLLALYALQRWLLDGAWREAVLFGLAAGLAVGTKFSAVPFLGLALPALAAMRAWLGPAPVATATPPPRPRDWLLGLALACLAALVPLFLAYGPRSPNPAGVALRFDWAVAYLLQRPGADHVLGTLLAHLWLPRELKDLVNGVVAVKAHNDSGHLSYLLGHTSMSGWWYFYLVALAVKTPLPLLLAGPMGVAWLAGEGWRARDCWRLAPAVLLVVLLTFASVFSHINIGIRHVLVLYPFLAAGGAYAALRGYRALPRLGAALRLPAAAGLAVLLLWQLSTLWRAYPDYLPYFNEAVPDPERVLVDSDLDWGQDLKRLERRAAALGIGHLYLAYRGTADLAREALPPFTVLGARQPVTGWVAVSALARTRNPADYAWLGAYVPLERIGKTIDLYFIP